MELPYALNEASSNEVQTIGCVQDDTPVHGCLAGGTVTTNQRQEQHVDEIDEETIEQYVLESESIESESRQ